MRLWMSVSMAMLLAAPAAATAAEPLAVTLSTDHALPVSGAIDWNGFYAGVFGVAQAGDGEAAGFGIGADIGLNARFEFVLVGAEVAIHSRTDGAGAGTYVQGIGRVGVAVTDDLVIYGAGGAGTDLGPVAETDALVGGGVEFALTESVSLRGQYLHGFAVEGDERTEQVTFGANFHF